MLLLVVHYTVAVFDTLSHIYLLEIHRTFHWLTIENIVPKYQIILATFLKTVSCKMKICFYVLSFTTHCSLYQSKACIASSQKSPSSCVFSNLLLSLRIVLSFQEYFLLFSDLYTEACWFIDWSKFSIVNNKDLFYLQYFESVHFSMLSNKFKIISNSQAF